MNGSIADTALDCYASYLDHRRSVVSQVVLAKLESLRVGKDVLAMVITCECVFSTSLEFQYHAEGIQHRVLRL